MRMDTPVIFFLLSKSREKPNIERGEEGDCEQEKKDEMESD